MPLIVPSLIFSTFYVLSFPMFLLTAARHNAAPLIDLKWSNVGTISLSLRWAPLGLTSSIVDSIMVELHARTISPNLYIAYACLCVFESVPWCVDQRIHGREWTHFVAAV